MSSSNLDDRTSTDSFREAWKSECILPHRYFVFAHEFFQTELPFYKRYPKLTGAALGATGTVLLAPVAIVGGLTAVGFTSAGVAAGSLFFVT